jgi:hypothetical protein
VRVFLSNEFAPFWCQISDSRMLQSAIASHLFLTQCGYKRLIIVAINTLIYNSAIYILISYITFGITHLATNLFITIKKR